LNGDERVIFRKKAASVLLVFAMVLAVLPGFSNKVMAADTYIIQGVTLPLAKYPDGGRSYGRNECWAFAAMVYKTLWGQTFSVYRGTPDDILRDVDTGDARAITAENTKKFIEMAPLGSNIRIADRVNADDSTGRAMHSQILLQKDDNGLTIYESITPRIRIVYYTWEQYAEKHAKYKYFKYIKYPVPAEEPKPEETVNENRIAEFENTAKDIINGMDFEQWSAWLLTGKVYPDVLYR
jgi:hypothetical protein